MKRIIFILALLSAIVSCGKRENAVDMQIAVYEAGIKRISAASDIEEFKSVVEEVKEELIDIRRSNKKELRDISLDSYMNDSAALGMKQRLNKAMNEYKATCREKRKSFRVR